MKGTCGVPRFYLVMKFRAVVLKLWVMTPGLKDPFAVVT